VDGWMDKESEFFRRTPPKGGDVCYAEEWVGIFDMLASSVVDNG
jgi:hypothetical protein